MLPSSAEPLTLGSSWALGAARGVNRHPPAAQANTGRHKHYPSPRSPLLQLLLGKARPMGGVGTRPVHSPHPSLLRVTAPWQRTECSCLVPWPEQP